MKSHIKAKFDEWFSKYGILDGNKTKAGYLRAPKYSLLINWLLEACEEPSTELFVNSFKVTGIKFIMSNIIMTKCIKY